MYEAVESARAPVDGPSIRRTPTSGTSTDMAPTGATQTDATTQTNATTIKRAEANKDWTVWRVYTRRVFIVISVALGIAWSTSSAILEIHGWDERDPNRCYDYNPKAPPHDHYIITYRQTRHHTLILFGLAEQPRAST